MAATSTLAAPRRAQADPAAVRVALIGTALLVVGILVVIPMVYVFYGALKDGFGAYWNNLFHDPDTVSAILLTLRVAPTAVALNLVFGVAAAWAIARFRFPGRTLLTSLIDLPFAVSPVVAGLIFVLIFGLQGWVGGWLREHDLKIIFATPGLILATAFVTFPFVARELIPVMEALGSDEEVAAVSLGARGWQIFRRISLPNIKWGLLYGIILCNARAMGEFGAVYVVSGHIAGQTDTLPLRVEKLFQEYNNAGAYAAASLLSSLALVTLSVKTALEWKTRRELESRAREATQVDAAPAASAAVPLDAAAPAAPAIPADPAEPRAPRHLHAVPSVPTLDRAPGNGVDPAGAVASVGISIQHVTKRFGDFVALDDVSVDVPHGSLVALLGPSGSGKTTLLRIIAGLETADSGSIHYEDEDATDRSPRDRNVGFVFQHYALFRHMSVFENVAFGLRVRKWKRPAIEQRVNELLRLIQLDGLGGQMPSQLSGGQRQRVALARALAAAPKVLLLDEPFGALDAKVRQELRQWLRRLHDEIHVTSVFVTHDQEEAFEVADRVVVMNHGRIEQVGTPQDVFEQPANGFVMDFLGNVNVFHGRVEGGRALLHGGFEVDYPDYQDHEAKPATVYVRPHELEIDRNPSDRASLAAQVVRVNSAGIAVKVELAARDFGVVLNVVLSQDRYAELGLHAGDAVYVFPKRARVFVRDYSI